MRISREIYAIALPAIVANLTTPLLSLADMAIIGHLGSDILIAAIALGGTLFSALYWMFAFLRMGTSGMVAQSFGKSDNQAISLNLYRPLLISMALGVIIILFNDLIGNLLIRFLSDGDAAASSARSYYDILVFGAPATLGLYVVYGFLIGIQNSKAAMWLSISINVINIIATIVFVLILGMGVKGAASGSLIAQWIGFIAGITYILKNLVCLKVSFAKLLQWTEFRRYISINGDIFLRTVCLVAVTVWFTKAGASQSVTVLALNALLMQFFLLFSFFMDGFAYAGEAIVGKYVGAENIVKVRETIKSLLKIGTLLAIVFTLIYLLGGKQILGLLTSEYSIVDEAGIYAPWASLVPLVSFFAFVLDGVFIGATRSRYLLISVGVAMVVFFIVYFSCIGILGNHGLWLAFCLYLLVRSLISLFLCKRFLNGYSA